MARYKAAQVTVVNGEDLVRVVSGEPIDEIRQGDNLEIVQFNGVDILTAYTEDGTGVQIIQLADNWPHADQTLQSAVVVPTPVHFNNAAQALIDTKDKVFAQLASFFAFGSQATGTVTFNGITINDPDITIRSLGQLSDDITALEQQAQGSVDDVNAIDAQVNTPVTGLVDVVAGIDATLQGYALSASDDATKSQEYAVNPYSAVITGTTDYSSLHHATDSDAAKVIAVSAKDDTLILKSDVETLKTQTIDVYDDAYLLSTTPEDVEISSGVYSLKHYAAKAQEAAAAAIGAVASVTAALYFVGVWDASGNTAPPAPSGDGNPFYKISVAGSFAGDDYSPNDNAIWDNVNTTWIKVDNTESVVTVNGKSGAVVLAVADIAGLQSTLDTLQNNIDSKVAQTDYDTNLTDVSSRLLNLEMNIHIKQWAFIV